MINTVKLTPWALAMLLTCWSLVARSESPPLDQQLQQVAQELSQMIERARALALQNSRTVVVCSSVDHERCDDADHPLLWKEGFIALTTLDGEGQSLSFSPLDNVRKMSNPSALDEVRIRLNWGRTLAFNRHGAIMAEGADATLVRPTGAALFILCPANGDAKLAMGVKVSLLGRVSLTDENLDGSALRCR